MCLCGCVLRDDWNKSSFEIISRIHVGEMWFFRNVGKIMFKHKVVCFVTQISLRDIVVVGFYDTF